MYRLIKYRSKRTGNENNLSPIGVAMPLVAWIHIVPILRCNLHFWHDENNPIYVVDDRFTSSRIVSSSRRLAKLLYYVYD